jgi:hypothetical protein
MLITFQLLPCMKTLSIALLVTLFLIPACTDINVPDMGSQLLPANDAMTVNTETFSLKTEDLVVPYIYAFPDSFLLGTFYDAKYGTTHADIFAQVEKPASFVYPDSVTIIPDSVYLVLYYQQYFGDKFSPMNVSVYEMNKATFNYTTPYPSNLNPADYSDKSTLLGSKTFTAANAITNNTSNNVAIKLSNDFLQRIAQADPKIYESEQKFLDFFKGFYITTDFGSATMLYLRQIDMEYFHHYTYNIKDSNGRDSTVKVNNVFSFPANQTVRQVNRFLHPDTASVMTNLRAREKQVHYISSPANIFTRVSVPLREMHQQMNSNNKRLFINSARLRVDITDLDDNALAQPISTSLILVKESVMHRFFAKKELPADSVAVLGAYTFQLNRETGNREHYYDFNLARMVASEFNLAGNDPLQLPEYTDYVIVPVRITYNSNNAVTKVRHQILMNAVTVCGAKHPETPMKIRTIYTKY